MSNCSCNPLIKISNSKQLNSYRSLNENSSIFYNAIILQYRKLIAHHCSLTNTQKSIHTSNYSILTTVLNKYCKKSEKQTK